MVEINSPQRDSLDSGCCQWYRLPRSRTLVCYPILDLEDVISPINKIQATRSCVSGRLLLGWLDLGANVFVSGLHVNRIFNQSVGLSGG
jgi:hypothetical protein